MVEEVAEVADANEGVEVPGRGAEVVLIITAAEEVGNRLKMGSMAGR